MIGPGLPGFRFSRESILANAPAGSGVYVIYNPQIWIYVGETENLRARLLEHLNGDNQCISQLGPTGFQIELSPSAARVARQDALIVQLGPRCNRRLG